MPNDSSPSVQPASCSLAYVSLYFHAFEAAISFYTTVLGPPDTVTPDGNIQGWKFGNTWLTLFPSAIGTRPERNPANAEFAILVPRPDDVDRLHEALVDAGATTVMKPQDTWMYEPMRFCCVDDPFGARVDVLCPLPDRPDLEPQQGKE